MDRAVQKIVQRSLPARILHAYHYLQPVRHPAGHSIIHSMQCKVYWPHMINIVYTTLTDCCECTHNQANNTETRHLILFRTSGLLNFFAVSILLPFPKPINGQTTRENHGRSTFQAHKSRANLKISATHIEAFL